MFHATAAQHQLTHPKAQDVVGPFHGLSLPVVERALDEEVVAPVDQLLVHLLPGRNAILIQLDHVSVADLPSRIQPSGLPVFHIIAVHGDFCRRRLGQLALEEFDGIGHHAAPGVHDVLAPGLRMGVGATEAEGTDTSVGCVLSHGS
eukprot:Skav220246  [mRNA]  locus=scaffold3452:232902:248169:+ [translate_table: standard]